MRITLIHALRHSPPPIEEAFARIWPEAELRTILDDGLSKDVATAGGVTDAITDKFVTLTRYAVGNGTDAILFTCSAFGPCIEHCAALFPGIPILKPNEAMIEEVCAVGGRVGLVATFAPTLLSLPAEFPPATHLTTKLAEGALEALNNGDVARHDDCVAAAASELVSCDIIALAQFSLARAAGSVARATNKPVYSTPDSAVRKLRRLLIG